MTKEQEKWLKRYVPGHHKPQICKRFEEKYGEKLPIGTLRGWMKRNNVTTGFTGSEGIEAVMKGKKITDEAILRKIRATQYKKGNKPACTRPLYSTTTRKDGTVFIKIGEPNKWMIRARYIWQQHYGPLKKGEKILHLNGDSTDDDISNLMKISNAEQGPINSKGLIKDDRDLTKAGVLQHRLEKLIEKREEERS